MSDKFPAFDVDYDFAVGEPAAPDIQFYAGFGKRALDLLIATLVLPVVLPILALVWIVGQLIGGQPFFGQERVGRHGETFRCYKVRTMVRDADRVLLDLIERDEEVAAEWHKFQKLRRDPRVTRWGHFLRKTSIDELPQIFNVLRGDMSIVGPRPFMTRQLDLYRAGGGHRYFSLRPGITGEWQVIGRGETSFVERVRFDNAYWEKLTLWHDVRLILGTVGALAKRTGH